MLDHWKVPILQNQNLHLVETSFYNFVLVNNKEMSFWLFRAKTSDKYFFIGGFALAISFFCFVFVLKIFFLLFGIFVIFGGALGNLMDHFFVGRGHRFS